MAGGRRAGKEEEPLLTSPRQAMPSLPSEVSAVSPLDAGLLLSALPLLRRFDLPTPTVDDVLGATHVGRSRAYELKAAIEAALPALLRPPGRPAAPEAPPIPRPDLAGAALEFVYAHPGAVEGAGSRRRYSDAYRRFLLELVAAHRDVPLADFAAAVRIPLPTLKDWLRGGTVETAPGETLAAQVSPDPTGPQLEQLLALWASWHGSFSAFCQHANEDWRLPFRRTLISRILVAHGVRFPKRRSGRSPDEDALRGQFQTFFPNAQWVGDGALQTVTVGTETFPFNLELLVDPCSGAFTGAAVTDTEDAAAVVAAFDDGVATTGGTPLSVLLDNKPSNHAEDVKAALDPAVVERATPFRPQNKAHVEGAFGLFSQVAPALALVVTTPREIARQFLVAVVTTWARTLNHKPRSDGGGSRVERHLDHVPTAEEVAAATAALQERIRRQDRARQTLAARQDPHVRKALADAFARLGFDDPDGELLNAIARYALDAVVDGIAIVEGKRRAGTLPADVDARYLLGVVRNITEEREGWEIALALWEERTRAHDRALDAAERARAALDEDVDDSELRVAAYVDRGLATSRRLDRFFWLTATADVILDEDPAEHHALFRLAARRIHATRAVPHPDRLAATRFLAARIVPVA